MKSLKLVSLAFLWLLVSVPKISTASGIGSQSWQSDSGGTSDSIGGFLLLVVLIGLLLFGWIKGKASIKWIYGPALVGGFILYLIIGKTTVKALLGYPVVGILVGWTLMFIYSLFDHKNEKILPPKDDIENDKKVSKNNLSAASQSRAVIFEAAPKTASSQPSMCAEGASRNQFCNPANLVALNAMLNSLPIHPGFAALTGPYGIRNVVVYGPNVQLAVRGFVDWAIKGTRSDWDEYLSLGFSPVKLSLVNSSSENKGREQALAQNESTRLSTLGRSRVFDGSIFLTMPSLESSISDYSNSRTTDTETAAKIAVYVGQKNSEAVADLLNLARPDIGGKQRSKMHEDFSVGLHKQSVLLSMPVRGFVPLSRCGQKGSLLTDEFVINFGADLMIFLECQCHRMALRHSVWNLT
jgi:hypothetical protein